jgi:hypothetical protein
LSTRRVVLPVGPSLASIRIVHVSRHSSRVVALVGGAALVVAVASCNTPSIPIPPPDARAISFAVDLELGEATFHYAPNPAYALGLAYVFNRTQGRGVIETAREDGSIGPTAPFPAAVDDEVSITIETDAQAVSTCVVLREGTPSQFCPAP